MTFTPSPHLTARPHASDPAPLKTFRFWSPWLLVFALGWAIVFYAAFPDRIALFRQNWPLIFVGVAGAFLGNMTAVGGGLVFVPTLMFAYQVPAVVAVKLSIVSQCFGMTSGAISWLRRGAVPIEALWVTVPALVAGSTVSTLLVQPSALLVKGLFGPVSILTGVLMLFLLHRSGTNVDLRRRARWPLMLTSFVGGLVTGWIAIGEGEFVAALLMIVYRMRVERGVGLGVVLLAVNSIYLLLLHQFVLGEVPWDLACFSGLGCVFGARLGTYVAQWVDARGIKRTFAVVAIADGLLFTVQAVWSLLR